MPNFRKVILYLILLVVPGGLVILSLLWIFNGVKKMKFFKRFKLANATLELIYLKELDLKLHGKWQNARSLALKAEKAGHEQYATALKARVIKFADQRTMIGNDINKLKAKIDQLEIEIELQS